MADRPMRIQRRRTKGWKMFIPARPLTGFFAKLSPQQQRQALQYQGEESFGKAPPPASGERG